MSKHPFMLEKVGGGRRGVAPDGFEIELWYVLSKYAKSMQLSGKNNSKPLSFVLRKLCGQKYQ